MNDACVAVLAPRQIMPKLTQTTAIRLLCVLRQAERSLAYVYVQSEWDELREYYDATRLALLEAVQTETVGNSTEMDPYRSLCLFCRLSLLRCFFNRFANKFRASWSISDRESAFVMSAIARFRDSLAEPRMPTQERVHAMYCAFLNSYRLVAVKLYGRREVQQCKLMEHYGQSRYMIRYALDEILSELGTHEGPVK